MRKLIALVVIAAVLYGGYWFVGRSQIDTRLTTALSEIDAGPTDLTYTSLNTRGFPSRFDTTITDLQFADAAAGVGYSTPSLRLFALSYRPNEVIAVFDPVQTVIVNGERLTILSDDMRASGKVRANTDLTFQTATIEATAPRVVRQDGAQFAMSRVLAAMRLTPDTTQTYDVFLEARDIALPAGIRRMIDPQNQQPDVIESLRFDSDLDLTEPLSLLGATDQPPQIASVAITEFALVWGGMSVSAIGDVTPDDAGLLNGSISISARNWQQAIDLAVSMGAIKNERRFLVTEIANNIDETPHIADTLTITLTITDGNMMLGGFPLGPAPVLR